jgi:hypothetical protein
MGWDKTEVLKEYINKVVDIQRSNEDLKSVLIKNILLDPKTYEMKEISYVEDKGKGRICHFRPGYNVLIRPTGETPYTEHTDSHESVEDLAERAD